MLEVERIVQLEWQVKESESKTTKDGKNKQRKQQNQTTNAPKNEEADTLSSPSIRHSSIWSEPPRHSIPAGSVFGATLRSSRPTRFHFCSMLSFSRLHTLHPLYIHPSLHPFLLLSSLHLLSLSTVLLEIGIPIGSII